MIQTLYYVESYEEEKVQAAINRLMEQLNIKEDLRPDMHVVLKPNMVMAKSPKYPATTHPLVVKAVVNWLAANGIRNITLAESSGGLYNREYMNNVYQVCGMKNLHPMLRLNMDFSAQTIYTKPGFANHSFHVITPIIEADYIINLCKLKTHAMTGFSGGMKNLFGVIPGLEKPQMHYLWPKLEDFSNMIVELDQMISPQLTIIDAIDAMEGNGPTGGTSHPLHLILGARDFYTQDYFACQLMQLDPMDIVMIRQAVERGLAKPQELELVGDPVPEQLTPFIVPDTKQSIDFSGKLPKILQKPFQWVAGKLFKSYPQLEYDKCIGCGKCAESCPAHVIDIREKKAIFQKKGCISCFCCQEMCPMKAISVKKAL